MTETIRVMRDAGIVTVILNRPEKLNAMTMEMYGRFGEAFDRINADESVRCVIVRGAGERAFCPGSDISEFDAVRTGLGKAREYARFTMDATLKLHHCPHPTVAQIQGVCVGGGLEIAAMCDLRICGRTSRFGIPINRLGLTVDYDELDILNRLIGPAATLEILLEGRIFGAEEALAKGLVSRVVEDGQVEAHALETAERIAGGAPLVNRWHKKFLRRLSDPRPVSAAERDEAFACYETEDYSLGCAAFAAKETPVFKGR